MSLSGIDPKGGFTSVAKPNAPAALFGVKEPAGVDLLDPEAMLAFFSQQMSNVRGQLAVAMKGQEARNLKAQTIQSLEASLVGFQEKGIKPSDDKWPEFLKTVEEAKVALGEGATKGLDEMIAKATKPSAQVMGKEDAEAAVKAGATMENLSPGVYKVSGVPAGLDKNDVGQFSAQLKAFRDGINNDNAMNMIRVQQLVENSSQLTNMASNIMKKLSDMAMSPINNMR